MRRNSGIPKGHRPLSRDAGRIILPHVFFPKPPTPPSKSRRRPAGFAPGRNATPSSPNPAAHEMRRNSGIPKGLGSSGKDVGSSILPRVFSPKPPTPPKQIPPPSGGICPGEKCNPIIPQPAAHEMRRNSGIPKGLRPFGRGFQGGQRPPWQRPPWRLPWQPASPRAPVAVRWDRRR